MLPTTGHFKNFTCPFYESCICERPYCHYKHLKRVTENVTDPNFISELVSKAVHTVLNNTPIENTEVKETKVTYNPTPISELNKYKTQKKNDTTEKKPRHIPIQYTPQRPQRYRHTMEYTVEDTSKSQKKSINYFPSSIKTLSTNTRTDSNSTSVNQSYIPSSSATENSNVNYTPTLNLNIVDVPNTEYVPKYNDAFIDEFLNDPNLFEGTTDTNARDKSHTRKSNEKKHSSHKSSSKSSSTNSRHSKHSSSNRSKHKDNGSSSSSSKKSDKHKSTSDKSKHSDKNDKQKSISGRSSSNSSSSKSKIKEHSNTTSDCDKKKKSEHKHRNSNNQSKEAIDILISEDDHLYDDDIRISSDCESDDSTLEQCKRIFDEYQAPSTNDTQTKIESKLDTNEDASVASTSRKRVAHANSTNVVREKIPKLSTVQNAAVIMANRYKNITAKLTNDSIKFENTVTPVIEATIKTKRIAHVPNVSSLLNAKKKVEETIKTNVINKTPVQTVVSGGKRIAHVPEISIAEIPSVLQVEKSKLPVNVRNRFLILMIKECTKLYINREAAYERALNEELNCYTKCSALSSYRNSVMLTINRLRKENDSGQITNEGSSRNSLAFSDGQFYINLSKWIMTRKELHENGYPQSGAPKKGYAVFYDNKIYEQIPSGCQKCARCKKIYKIDDKGHVLIPEDCIYHPGSRFVFRGESKYACCRGNSSSDGCCVCATHVHEVQDPSLLTGFVKTFKPETKDDPRSKTVYALDCEMVYTTRGIELARVTVINQKCDVIYETMVKPAGRILDCNTRYSGLTMEMLQTVTIRLVNVQATLLSMFNSKTILIGHSLESDLKALRIIHNKVIDTSVLFPHKMGPPKKRALRALASEYLEKIIQNEESGHDSAEDAITCMELIVWKLKEELKTR